MPDIEKPDLENDSAEPVLPAPASEPKLKSKKGLNVLLFTLIVILLTVAVGFGVYAWQQQEVKRLNNQISELQAKVNQPKDTQNTQEKEQSSIPDGWIEYKNEEFGFSFAYPKEWGDVTTQDGRKPHEGDHFYFHFSKYEQFNVAIKTSDYKYTGLGVGMPIVNGFTNYEQRYQEILKYEQGVENYHGEVVKKESNFIIFTRAEGYSGNFWVHGIAKLNKIPGLDFAYNKNAASLNLSDETYSKLYSGELSAREYISNEDIETVVTFANNIKSL